MVSSSVCLRWRTWGPDRWRNTAHRSTAWIRAHTCLSHPSCPHSLCGVGLGLWWRWRRWFWGRTVLRCGGWGGGMGMALTPETHAGQLVATQWRMAHDSFPKCCFFPCLSGFLQWPPQYSGERVVSGCVGLLNSGEGLIQNTAVSNVWFHLCSEKFPSGEKAWAYGECNRQLLFTSASRMHVHDGWLCGVFVYAVHFVTESVGPSGKIGGTGVRQPSGWIPAPALMCCEALDGLLYVPDPHWPHKALGGLNEAVHTGSPAGTQCKFTGWWQVLLSVVSSAFLSPVFVSGGSCALLSLEKGRSKEYFCWLFIGESHLVACNLRWIIPLHKGGQVLNQQMQSRGAPDAALPRTECKPSVVWFSGCDQ